MSPADANGLSARELLHLYLELQRMTPNLKDWSEDRLAANPPRLYRLKQLLALFQAFGIRSSPAEFQEGAFIDVDSPAYQPLLDRIASEMPGESAHDLGPQRRQLREFFKILFEYRVTVERALSFCSGVLEASGLYHYAYRKVGEVNRAIRQECAVVEDLLVSLISPEGKSFSVEELVRDHGYPAVDLFDIDADWW
jgi:hypothetical protein